MSPRQESSGGHLLQGRVVCLIALVGLALAIAGCAVELPRALREKYYGPDPTPTPRLKITPTPAPTVAIHTATPPPVPPRLPTLTAAPTRTPTITRTATPTASLASVTLQHGTIWYNGSRYVTFQGTEDTYISDWNRNGNFADSPVLSVRQGGIMAALVYFDLGNNLPRDFPLLRNELSLYITGRSNETPMVMSAHKILRAWLPLQTTWLRGYGGLPWETPGAKGPTDRAVQPTDVITATRSGVWVTFDVTSLAREWVKSPEFNQGVIITGDAPNAVQYDFASSEAAVTRLRPRLTLTFPTAALALAPPKVFTPTPSVTPTIDPLRPEAVDVTRLLPLGSTVLARASGDLDGDGRAEIVVGYRPARQTKLVVAVFRYYALGSGPGEYRLLWSSAELAGETSLGLELVDITGDSEADIIWGVGRSSQRMLYVLTARPAGYRLVLPVGGYFDGRDAFGESGYELADTDGDGQVEIIARYDSQTDTYKWDGLDFRWTGR